MHRCLLFIVSKSKMFSGHDRTVSTGSSVPSQLGSTIHQTLSIPIQHPVTSLSIAPTGRECVLAA
jgi:hypothetical protein